MGIDWATAEHAVCVLNRDGRKVTAFTVEHTAAGFAKLAARLGKLGEAEQGYSGKKPAAVLLARLRSAPAGTTDPILSEGVADAAGAQVGVLTALNAAIKNLDRSVGKRMDTHPDGQIFRSFPRAGTINAAQILAEWGDVREAFDHPDAVAALAGITPVTRTSGKQRRVSFR